MKVGPSLASQAPEVRLPIEIIEHIISFLPSSSADQHASWACCLVSSQWYSAAISTLYEAPRLGPNFDKFAATLCPPISTHTRRIGLELLVKHLDMSGVAYESSNSQTARLLRRVGPNLEVFVAPSTSFSTSSLAPLAKCDQLRILDLRLTQTHRTSSSSGIDIYALLRSLCKLKSLVVVSLPPLAASLGDVQDARRADINWPPNLSDLYFNGALPRSTSWWQEATNRWPETLRSLWFHDCRDLTSIMYMGLQEISFPQIRSLRVKGDRFNSFGVMYLPLWSKIFPKLRFLSMPAVAMESVDEGEMPHLPSLERLEITGGMNEPPHFPNVRLMRNLAKNMTALWQMRLHESLSTLDDIGSNYHDVDNLLRKRAKESNETAGWALHDLEQAGVIFGND